MRKFLTNSFSTRTGMTLLIDIFSVVLLSLLVSMVSAIPGLFDLAQDAADKARYPEITGFYRIEADILRLDNPRGTTKGWMPCDIFAGSCDPLVTGVIDYHTPNYDFGKDSVPYSRFSKLWSGNFDKSIQINQVMVKDVCGNPTRKVNVRIRAVDKDLLSDDTIDRWSCFILTTDPPADNEQSAKWSDEKTCVGHNSAHKIFWRYRWYRIDPSTCKEADGSSGVFRRIIPFVGK